MPYALSLRDGAWCRTYRAAQKGFLHDFTFFAFSASNFAFFPKTNFTRNTLMEEPTLRAQNASSMGSMSCQALIDGKLQKPVLFWRLI
jgi:hypothetical protein